MSSPDLDRLVAAVQREAWEDARHRLRAELAEQWVVEGRRRLGLSSRGALPPGAGDRAEALDGDTPAGGEGTGAVWVYGLVAAGCPNPAERGVGGGAVELLDGERLAAVVSPLDAPPDPDDTDGVADAARAHDAVLRAAFDAGSVLPLRFGTVLRRSDAARLPADAGLAAAFSAVEGLAEWKLSVRRSGPPPGTGGSPPPGDESGAAYLARKATALAASDPRAVSAALERLVGPVALARHGDHVLVARRSEEALRAAVSTLGHELGEGWDVSLAGPWPAFHFTDLAARS